MEQTDNSVLLKRYSEDHSDEAFAELVTRHINLVYSVALRQVGDPHQAEEVAQTVFITLAKKAAQLRHDKALSSWLFQTTRLTANNFMRGETRRHRREQEAHVRSVLNESRGDDWPSIAPLLDDAVEGLSEKDRLVIVLRFYEGRNLREVGAALGASEDAAQKRIRRAVEHLREYFAKRGVTVAASGLVVAVSANAVQTAPVGLAITISTAVALAGTAVSSSTVIAATKTIAMTPLTKALIITTIAASVGTGIYESRQALVFRHQNELSQQQRARLAGQMDTLERERNDALTRVASLTGEIAEMKRNDGELLRLRGEVGRLRREALELTQMKAAAQQRSDVSATSEKSELDRLNYLIEWLQRNPSENSPELKLLTAQEWLKFMDDKLNTDGDYQRNIAHVRAAAELTKITPALYSALKEYVRTNNGQFPTDLSQMKPYFDSAIDDAILQRWEIIPVTSVSSLIVKSGVDMGGAWVITQKGPVNAGWDARVLIGTTNYLASLEPTRWSIAQ